MQPRNVDDDEAAKIVDHKIIQPVELSIYRYPPFFITFMSIFQLVTFLYYTLRAEDPITLSGPVPFNSKLIYNPYRRYEIWRYLTYSLIHAGYGHLIFNIIIQLAVGVPLEMVHDFKSIFVIYIGGVIGGSLGNSIGDPHTYLAGASGGCYALIAAHLSNLMINWKELETERPCFKFLSLVLFSGIDFGLAVYERHSPYESRGWRVSYGSHMAGFVSGLLLGLIFLKRLQKHSSQKVLDQWARYILIVLMTMAVAINIFDPYYFPLPDYKDLVWAQSPFSRTRE